MRPPRLSGAAHLASVRRRAMPVAEWTPERERHDPDRLGGLTADDIRAWGLYELENARARAMRDMESDEDFFEKRGRIVRASYRMMATA